MELKWGTVCETLEWENRELDEMSQEERGPRRSAQMDKVLCVVILAPEDVWRLDVTLTLMKVI